MSRSAVVAWVAAIALVAGVAGVVGHEWVWLLPHKVWWIALIVAGTVYAAATSAVLIRRIAEPTLDMPWLAIIGIVILIVLELFVEVESGGGGYNYNSRYRSRSSSEKGIGLFSAIFSSIVALAFYGGGITALVYIAKDRREAVATSVAASPESKPEPEPEPEANAVAPAVASAPKTLADELSTVQLTDVRTAPSPAASAIATWLDAHGKWADVAVAKDETSLALVEKDPMPEAGKRLCVRGTLERIERTTVDRTSLFTARLTTKDGDALEVYAVHGSGDLVKRSAARFCGVVTGRLDRGGTPATFAVGMFEMNAEK